MAHFSAYAPKPRSKVSFVAQASFLHKDGEEIFVDAEQRENEIDRNLSSVFKL